MITVQKTYEFHPESDLIGRGGFGTVYRALDRNLNMQVALKKYSGNLPAKYSLFEEIKRVIRLNHPNLVRYYDAFELNEASAFGDKIQVGILELVNGGDLTAFLAKKPNVAILSEIVLGIMSGLQYLHQQQIIHRDLKPENILLQYEGNDIIPKIADFGISKALKDTSSSSNSSLVIGSIEYMAPEQFNAQRFAVNGQINTNLDIWALGIIIGEMFTGEAAFGKTALGLSREMIMRQIFDKDLKDYLAKIPEPFRSIAQRCLVRSAKDRAQSVDELFDIYYKKSLQLTPKQQTERIKHWHTSVVAAEQIPPTESTELPLATVAPQNIAIPFITALLGIFVFYSKNTLFGGGTDIAAQPFLYSGIVSTILLVINCVALVLGRQQTALFSPYLASFVILLFFNVVSFLSANYEKLKASMPEGIVLTPDTNVPWFQYYYPLLSIGVVILLSVLRWKKMNWTEPISIAIISCFLVFLMIQSQNVSPAMGTVLAVGSIILCGAMLMGLRNKANK
ncbi:MAG: serine/threonine protein kinase [Chitinophagales bacterium]|jgi:serine/threonine protein kinase|nr:serine/threonine protein kinase [Chitinophagales bacterium]